MVVRVQEGGETSREMIKKVFYNNWIFRVIVTRSSSFSFSSYQDWWQWCLFVTSVTGEEKQPTHTSYKLQNEQEPVDKGKIFIDIPTQMFTRIIGS